MNFYTIFFSWYGGKLRMLDILLYLIPKCTEFYELYGGSGAMTLNCPYKVKKIFNELDKDIFNLWEVVQGKRYEEFADKLSRLEYSKETFTKAKKALQTKTDAFMRAVYTFVTITQSFNATRKGFSKKEKKYYPVDNYLKSIDVHNIMKDVELHNEDALNIVKGNRHKKNAFMFLDPPYLHEHRSKGATQVYGKEMTSGEHEQLLKVIRDADCMIMLCGYRSGEGKPELYDRILRSGKCGNRWHCYLLAELHAPGIKGAKRQEYIWVNYELPKAAQYLIDTTDVMQH